jgi:L-ribulose-5-phosphate 3-epimerase UlaE
VILAKGQLLGVHVKDAVPQIIRGAPIGKGIVPFQETFQALTQMRFWGLIGIEMRGQMYADQDPIDCVVSACKFVDCLVKEAWPSDAQNSHTFYRDHQRRYSRSDKIPF